jgi:hypothetical protein
VHRHMYIVRLYSYTCRNGENTSSFGYTMYVLYGIYLVFYRSDRDKMLRLTREDIQPTPLRSRPLTRVSSTSFIPTSLRPSGHALCAFFLFFFVIIHRYIYYIIICTYLANENSKKLTADRGFFFERFAALSSE